MRSLDIRRYENGEKQHEQNDYVNWIGVSLEYPVVHQQYYGTQGQRKTYPHNLLAGKFIQVEQRSIVKIITRSVYAESSGTYQHQINQDRDPVKAPESPKATFSVW